MKARSIATTVLAAVAATFSAGDVRAAGQVTGIAVTAAPATHLGACPVTVTFTAKVTMNGAGSVVYKWERSDGAIDSLSHPPLVFPAAGTQAVTTRWKLGADTPAFQPFNGWQKLRILRPNQMLSEPAKFVLNCVKPGKPDLVPGLAPAMDGYVEVENKGTGPAGPSKLLLKCQKVSPVGYGGACPLKTTSLTPPWSFVPGGFAIDVPSLDPGIGFGSPVPGWASVVFTPGTYQFTLTADYTNFVDESNESNNTKTSTLTK